jgi:hypothetical protein
MKKTAARPKKTQEKADAQAGESLESIFKKLREMLARHAPPFQLCDAGVRNKDSVQLVVPKPVAIPGAYGGKPVNVQLAAAILQKGYVGFYLMCIYMNEGARKQLSPALLKLLKGKTCFHVNRLDEGLEKDIEAALVWGTKSYQERGWV